MSACLADASLVPGARDLVTALSDAGVPLGVVSSAVYHPFLEWALERHSVRDRFGPVTTSASCGYYKSRPEIYWLTLEQLDATGERSIHLGDSARFDVLGARRAGMRTVWLNPKGADPGESAPDHTVTSLRDAIEPIISMLTG
jgi:FMN phosphatase YigB (HAD superfamily)